MNTICYDLIVKVGLWRWECIYYKPPCNVCFTVATARFVPRPSHCRILDPVTACNSHINAIWKSQKCGMFLSISKKPSPHHSKLTQTHHDLNRKIFQISILGFTVFKVWNVINTLFTHDCFGFLLVCSYQRYHLPPDRKQRSRKFVINWPRYVPHWSLLTVKAFCNWGDQYSSTTRWI